MRVLCRRNSRTSFMARERLESSGTLAEAVETIRGFVMAPLAALVPLFHAWIGPLRDLAVTMVSPTSDCGGDCKSFADAGLLIPVFTHEPLDCETRTHHTNMDTYEYLHEEHLKQAAVVLASVV